MSILDRDGLTQEAPALDELPANAPALAGPIQVHGKFFFAGDAKHFVKGVTYGPFAEGSSSARRFRSTRSSSAISR